MAADLTSQFLLDTNIVIAIFAREPGVLQQLQLADELFLPCIALGELYYGARKSGRMTANIQRVDDFAAQNAILNCDLETAQQYGVIRDSLRAKGRPLPENDIWIAALALQHGMTLVSRDAHFREIADLNVTAW